MPRNLEGISVSVNGTPVEDFPHAVVTPLDESNPDVGVVVVDRNDRRFSNIGSFHRARLIEISGRFSKGLFALGFTLEAIAAGSKVLQPLISPNTPPISELPIFYHIDQGLRDPKFMTVFALAGAQAALEGALNGFSRFRAAGKALRHTGVRTISPGTSSGPTEKW